MAKANDLDLEIVKTVPDAGVSEEYLKINPVGKIPSFVGSDGYTLIESIAIAIYGVSFLLHTTKLAITNDEYLSSISVIPV